MTILNSVDSDSNEDDSQKVHTKTDRNKDRSARFTKAHHCETELVGEGRGDKKRTDKRSNEADKRKFEKMNEAFWSGDTQKIRKVVTQAVADEGEDNEVADQCANTAEKGNFNCGETLHQFCEHNTCRSDRECGCKKETGDKAREDTYDRIVTVKTNIDMVDVNQISNNNTDEHKKEIAYEMFRFFVACHA